MIKMIIGCMLFATGYILNKMNENVGAGLILAGFAVLIVF